MVLAVQLFNKIKKKKGEEDKEHENKFRCISRMLCQNTFLGGEFILFCMF